MRVMKRTSHTLLLLAAALVVATPAFAAKDKKDNKDERFQLASVPTFEGHRPNNTAALASVAVDKKDTVFTIGLEALKWMGATSRQVGVPYPELWCADFVNFVLRKTGHATTNSRAARSFLDYGKRIDSPRVGAI